jgi:hypothetical protein
MASIRTRTSATQNAGSHDNVAIAVQGRLRFRFHLVDVRTDSKPIKRELPDIPTRSTDFCDGQHSQRRHAGQGPRIVKDHMPPSRACCSSPKIPAAAMLRNPVSRPAKIEPTFYDGFPDLMKKAGVDPSGTRQQPPSAQKNLTGRPDLSGLDSPCQGSKPHQDLPQWHAGAEERRFEV